MDLKEKIIVPVQCLVIQSQESYLKKIKRFKIMLDIIKDKIIQNYYKECC